MKTILGVDNGTQGSLAYYNGDELLIRDIPSFKIKNRNAVDVHGLKAAIMENRPDHAVVEKLAPLPKISGLTAFSMGYCEGLVVGVLTAYNIPYTLVRPQEWKKAMGVTKDKDSCRQKADQIFPQYRDNWTRKKDIDRIEASLIAYYGFNELNAT